VKSKVSGIVAAMAVVLTLDAARAEGPTKPAPRSVVGQQAKYEAAIVALASANVGVRAGAIVTLEDVGADEAAPKALRVDALQKAVDARAGDKAALPLLLADCRRALEADFDTATTVRFRLSMATALLAAKDARGAKVAIDPAVADFDRLPREVQDDLAPVLVSVLTANGDTAGAIRWTTVLVEKGLASSESEEIAYRLKLADLLIASGRSDDGMALAQKLMDRIDVMAPMDASAVVQWIALRQVDAGNFKAAADAIRKTMAARNATATAGDLMVLRNRLGAILYAAKDEAAAEQEYRTVLLTRKNMPPESRPLSSSALSAADTALKALVQIHRAGGRSEQVLALAEEFLADQNVAPATVATLVEAGQWAAGTNAVAAGRVMDAARRRAAAQADDASVVDACQQAVVRLKVAVPGRAAEALPEARVYYRICQTTKLADAAELVALTFKSADRNLSRANAFLKFQKYGSAGMDGVAGTPDDVVDPLAAIPALAADAPRNKPFADALAAATSDYAGMRTRARLLLLMGQSGQAFEALIRAFELCPAKDADLQAATDDLTAFVVRHTRDLALAQRVVDYVMDGPAGADGAPGTPDDPGDAFGEVRTRLAGHGG
jgi:tetratricopeptide (TPR) repeat protein